MSGYLPYESIMEANGLGPKEMMTKFIVAYK